MPSEPSLVLSPNPLDFGVVYVDDVARVLPLVVRGTDLTADITISGGGDTGFSVDVGSISAAEAMAGVGVTLEIVYNPSGANGPGAVSSALTFESGSISQSLSLRAELLPRPEIVISASTLDFGRVIFGVSEPVRRMINVRGVALTGDISLSVTGILGFRVPAEIGQTAALSGYDLEVVYDVSEAPGVSDLGGTLTLSSTAAADVSVVLHVEVVEPVPPVDPGPQVGPRSVSQTAGFVLFPNPASNTLYIRHLSSPDSRVTAYTLGGHPVLRTFFGGGQSPPSLDLTGLVPGAYILQIETEGGIISRPFVKQ